MEINKQQIETLKANSFSCRYAGVGTDCKIFFDSLEELKAGIDAVIEGKSYLEHRIVEDTMKWTKQNEKEARDSER